MEDSNRILKTSFCAAANQLAHLYKASLGQYRQGYIAGHQHALTEIFNWLLKQSESSTLSTQHLLEFLRELEGREVLSSEEIPSPQQNVTPPNVVAQRAQNVEDPRESKRDPNETSNRNHRDMDVTGWQFPPFQGGPSNRVPIIPPFPLSPSFQFTATPLPSTPSQTPSSSSISTPSSSGTLISTSAGLFDDRSSSLQEVGLKMDRKRMLDWNRIADRINGMDICFEDFHISKIARH
eukprot:TRINITY_DN8031_c0_g1_i1.p1 TRINITY_DN8031_c0_g1~~TRINITY_DN8031_c0_g1_i1.p1  ORF type:complete len:237 (-),score=48.47 TRINITY_DN8031_c0_g1_i1:188-898(-)